MKIARVFLRILVGGLFVGHGTQKLFGWFGGHGLTSTGQTFEKMGLRPGVPNAAAAGLSEAGGGAALALGYRTPLAAAALIGTMLTAINRVHLKNGPWVTNGGYEYNAVLIAAITLLAELGPGPLSLDALRGRERSGAVSGLLALGLGAAGATGAHLLNDRLGGSGAAATPAVAPVESTAPSPAATDSSAVDAVTKPVA